MNQSVTLQIHIPEQVREILDVLKRSGYEAYIVGGCVRDALLGREPEDWDITTSALPEEVKALFRNTVDTGIQHGTVMVILGGTGYEVTTYRVDGAYLDSRHPSSVTFTRSLEEDLKRRDFTINAFAWDEDGLIDRFDGLSDLAGKTIRCVGDPEKRFDEDALRIMRAVRFSAQLGFEIEPKTAEMAQQYASRLADISMERIRVEWEKTLLSDHPCEINRYAEFGMAPYIVKDLYGKCFDPARNGLLLELHRRKSSCISENGREGSEQTDHFGNTTQLYGTDRYRRLMLAAFFGNLTAEETDQAFRDLKYDNRTREAVRDIIRYQEEELSEDRIRIRQALNRMGEETFFAVLELRSAMLQATEADRSETAVSAGTADKEDLLTESRIREIEETARDIIRKGEPYKISQLAVTGTDLIEAGVPAGKKIGDFLEKILQKVIQSPTLNRREILCSTEFLMEVEHECKGTI